MSYSRHDFKMRPVFTSQAANEMDAQIAKDADTIGENVLETTAQTLTGAVNELKDRADVALVVTQKSYTAGEKAQARANIGLTYSDDGNGNITVS